MRNHRLLLVRIILNPTPYIPEPHSRSSQYVFPENQCCYEFDFPLLCLRYSQDKLVPVRSQIFSVGFKMHLLRALCLQRLFAIANSMVVIHFLCFSNTTISGSRRSSDELVCASVPPQRFVSRYLQNWNFDVEFLDSLTDCTGNQPFSSQLQNSPIKRYRPGAVIAKIVSILCISHTPRSDSIQHSLALFHFRIWCKVFHKF